MSKSKYKHIYIFPDHEFEVVSSSTDGDGSRGVFRSLYDDGLTVLTWENMKKIETLEPRVRVKYVGGSPKEYTFIWPNGELPEIGSIWYMPDYQQFVEVTEAGNKTCNIGGWKTFHGQKVSFDEDV